jgi:hypothetical protein
MKKVQIASVYIVTVEGLKNYVCRKKYLQYVRYRGQIDKLLLEMRVDIRNVG